MIHYYTYLPHKTIVVNFFKTMPYTQYLSLNVAVPLLCAGQAFASKHDGPENGVVWGDIFWAYCTISSLNRVAPSPIPDASFLR